MQDFSSKHIIPYMEQKIRVLNQQVFISVICSIVREPFYISVCNWFQPLSSTEIFDSSSFVLQVSATRKGFRNQIKNLWWRKGKEDVVDSPSGPTYAIQKILFHCYCVCLCSSNMAFLFPILGIPLAPLNLRLEFWVITPSCYEIMNLHCRTIA